MFSGAEAPVMGTSDDNRGRKRYFHTEEESENYGNRSQKRYFHMENESKNHGGPEYIENSSSWKQDSQNETRKKHGKDIKTEKTHSEENNLHPDLQETLIYYENVLKSLKQGINDSKDVFSNNVLEQTKGCEVELACHQRCSHCIDLLFSHCNDPAIFSRFMTAFAEKRMEVCTNANASHITETIIYYALSSMQNWASVVESSNDTEKREEVTAVITWLYSFGQFCVENFVLLLENNFACHVLTSLIQALGGQYLNETSFESKKAKTYKAKFREQYLGEENTPTRVSIIIEQIPKFFIKILKQMSKVIIVQENISDIARQSSSATVIQALLTTLKTRLPKQSKKVIAVIATSLFYRKYSDGIPLAFLHKNSSYVVEKLFETAQEEQQKELWDQYFSSYLNKLVIDPVGNYVVQRLFDVVTSKSQFQIMSEAVSMLFEHILEQRCFGIFVSMAAASARLKSQQAQFMQNMMQCLQCKEPEDRQLCLVPLVLGVKKYDESRTQSSDLEICLQGSLIVQSILRFFKPIKVVNSILSMKPEDLILLASHIQGCHVLTCFFEDNNNVGNKNKDKLIQLMKPIFPAIASDRGGSLTLSRLWVQLSLKQRDIIAGELLFHERRLQENRNASIILKKFGIFHYKHNRQKWKDMHLNFSKKK